MDCINCPGSTFEGAGAPDDDADCALAPADITIVAIAVTTKACFTRITSVLAR
jgi:hypothetical protein